MTSHLTQAYGQDIRFRIDERMNPQGSVLQATDITEGVVLNQSGVRVTAFDVDHAHVRPAFGYRIDYAGRSLVLSGDTRVSENLIRYATGTDVLIHEVFVPEMLLRMGVPPDRAHSVADYHTTPEQAGTVFARAKPRLAVYSHVCPPITAAELLVQPTRRTYQGPLELGEDLMVIEVGQTVAVRRLAPPPQ